MGLQKKILFTDAEEPGLNGMTAIWENNYEVFGTADLTLLLSPFLDCIGLELGFLHLGLQFVQFHDIFL